jgi:hypothetical protein
VVGWAGLIPSEGKTLVSKDFGTINSRLIRFKRETDKGRTPWVSGSFLPHVQTQLAIGSMKRGVIDHNGKIVGQDDPISQYESWSDFMKSCPNQVKAWKFLWGVNHDKLMKRCEQFPVASLCLPPQAGGLGFPFPPEGSPFFQTRQPRTVQLVLARMLLDEGTREHHQLRSDWLSLLQEEREQPADRCVFRQLSESLRKVGCPLLRIPVSDSTSALVPPDSQFLITHAPIGGVRDSTLGDRRSFMFRALREAVYYYSASGRGPWTSSAVVDFLREYRWKTVYGRYSSTQ